MIFLHGGNDHPDYREATFGRFAAQAGHHLCLIVVEETQAAAKESFAAYAAIFNALATPPQQLSPLLVTPNNPLTAVSLEQLQPTAVFVCGGVTPLYHRLLCQTDTLATFLQQTQLPFGGTSAGAAIAAKTAVLGGWQATHQQRPRPILFQGASEGLNPLTVAPALSLVPFGIDVHASQMGTLTRLIHAVSLRLVPEGWAIDENSALIIEQGELSVHGAGQAYRVWSDDNGVVQLTIHPAA